MKKNIKLFGLFLALFAAVGLYSCKSNEVDPNIPTQLRVGSITSTGATLMWSGNAGSYNVEVNGQTATTETTSYTATGLTPSTSYTWRVRAVVGDGYSDWASGSFTTTAEGGAEADFTVSVNFGDGEEVWDAIAVYAAEEGDSYLYIDFYMDENSAISSTNGVVAMSGTTTFPSDDNVYWDYWSADYENRVVIIAEEGEDAYEAGDWWESSGTVTITSYANSLVSGSVNLVMFDAYDSIMQGNENPATKTLVVNFTNVPVLPESEAVQSAWNFKPYASQSRSVRK